MTHATSQNTIALHSIRIESPCTASWANMKGDERVRHCGDCNKNVFNLSAMTEAQGAALLAADSGGELCVRFYQRADGTVMTSDCSTSARAATRRTVRKVPVLAGAALLAVSAAVAVSAAPMPVVRVTQPAPVRDVGTMMMGAPMAQPVPVAPVVSPPLPVPEPVAVPMMGKPMMEALKVPADAAKAPAPLSR